MYEAVYMAATGLRQQQLRLDTIAHNVSNVNTTGYKATRLDFRDAIYTAGSLGPLASPEENHQKGHGVMAAANHRIYTDGSLLSSERQLDFAIQGPGFLAVENAYSEVQYTRSANLYLSGDEGEALSLVDSQGRFVLDQSGSRITVPADTADITVDERGLMVFDGDVENPVQLGLFTFENVKGLDNVGSDNFRPTVASGEAQAAGEDVFIHQGALEASNVNLADEMTRMIRAQRAFSLASRCLSTADDMEGIANNMRR